MADLHFSYVAIDPAGRRRKGVVSAADQGSAYDQLKRDGYSPLKLKTRAETKTPAKIKPLGSRTTADFLSGLSELLDAGADIRTALGIIGARFDQPVVKRMSEQLSADIAGGEALDRAFARAFQRSQDFVAPMVAAGEAGGDLPGGLRRAAEVIYSRLKLRDQLASVLAYPTFVFLMSIAAIFVILLFIIPTIAPLAHELGSEPPLAMSIMIAASDFLRQNLTLLEMGAVGLIGSIIVLARLGVLSAPIDALLLDGPARRTIGGLTFGAFAISLGAMLSAGAPVSDALRLAIRAAPMKGARNRLEPVAQAVRQGEFLSDALGQVRNFPGSILRLIAVGEASNRLGPMLARSGRLEEEAALRRIETVGRILGPALIVVLGGLLGLLMAGLLSGVSQMGQSALG